MSTCKACVGCLKMKECQKFTLRLTLHSSSSSRFRPHLGLTVVLAGEVYSTSSSGFRVAPTDALPWSNSLPVGTTIGSRYKCQSSSQTQSPCIYQVTSDQ